MGRDPRLLHAASMLYFAAATTFESRRRNGLRESFLLADDEGFRKVVVELARTFPNSDKPSAVTVYEWAGRVESLIAPWNSVGLFRPSQPNMYWYTAADKGE